MGVRDNYFDALGRALSHCSKDNPGDDQIRVIAQLMLPFQSEESIFLAALELGDPEKRAQFVSTACGPDTQLRGQVEDLLAAYPDGEFLESPVVDIDACAFLPLEEQKIGDTIGPYKLLEQIGEGGMGLVYMAEQTHPFRRRVALKIIKPGLDTRAVVARFEAERQALALMDHTHIARVYDAGATSAGRPYFVMELVDGVPITDYCRQHQLELRQRIDLFIEVCRAVQHAHQKGIIHRDLKPTNVLVSQTDTGPVPKVIDFGVAKAMTQPLTERTAFTGLSQLIGTPLYMSPEQAELGNQDIDTRSDVYSLGAVLYEILTGITPFDAKRFKSVSADEMRRIVREEEPPKPSRRSKTIRAVSVDGTVTETESTSYGIDASALKGDLDWIVMKALEKDRRRRYESPKEFADDLARCMDNEPILARPITVVDKLMKWSRRNVAVVWAIASVLLISTLILLVTGLLVARSYRVAARQLEQTQKQERIANRVSQLLQQMIASAKGDEENGATYSVAQMLDDFCANLESQLSDSPEVEATLRATIGKAYADLGFPERADPHFKRAVTLARESQGDNDLTVGDALVNLAWNTKLLHKNDEFRQFANEALSIYRTNGGSPEQMIRALSAVQQSSGTAPEADRAAEEALAIAGDLSTTAIGDVAAILHVRSDTKRKLGEYQEAEQFAGMAVALHRRLNGNQHEQTAWGLNTLGMALQANRKFEEAEAAYRESRTIFLQNAEIWHQGVRDVDKNLIKLFESKENPPPDLQALRDEVILAYREFKRLHPDDPTAHAAFAVARYRYGNREELGEIIASYRDAILLSPTRALYHNNLGVLLFKNSQIAESIEPLRTAVHLEPDNAAGHFNLAVALHSNDDESEAIEQLRLATKIDPKIGYRDTGYTMRLSRKYILEVMKRLEEESKEDRITGP